MSQIQIIHNTIRLSEQKLTMKMSCFVCIKSQTNLLVFSAWKLIPEQKQNEWLLKQKAININIG